MEKLKEISQYVLAGMVALGFFVLIILLVKVEIPEANSDVLNLVVGALIGSFTTIVSYFFGSSKGSSDKTKMLGGQK